MSEIHDTDGSLLRCTCGCTDIIAIRPGTEPIHDLFLLNAGEPTLAWCKACAPWWREPARECVA